eukprot:TRINITY_DN31196_c0_g1_i1.p1 TRINITY_DN31196_c0_g1~~TRINITY_DN31196_c0_g1_i1.p1  ORF type:complete len:234 (+),score=39.49 TRINITY_DN31196_c0_g1_i1:87-788(+)
MQSTIYKTFENRETIQDDCTLLHHTRFAEQVLGAPRLPDKLKGEQFWENLVRETRGRMCSTWFGWCLETLAIVIVVMAMAMELYGSCPVEMGLLPTCRYCYSEQFLWWHGVFVSLWFFDLYFFVLLVSKGFAMRTERGIWVDNEDRGIARNTITSFLVLTAMIAVVWLVGIFLYFEGGMDCRPGFQSMRPMWAQENVGRSSLMVNSLFYSLVLGPFVILLGRMHSHDTFEAEN